MTPGERAMARIGAFVRRRPSAVPRSTRTEMLCGVWRPDERPGESDGGGWTNVAHSAERERELRREILDRIESAAPKSLLRRRLRRLGRALHRDLRDDSRFADCGGARAPPDVCRIRFLCARAVR